MKLGKERREGPTELQDRYDGETARGGSKKKQKKWAARAPEMFREATEALEAMLAD